VTMSQNNAILEYLKKHEWINWEIARTEPTILSNNLTGRLDNLRKKGYQFEDRWITLKSGKECKEYRLVSEFASPYQQAENPPGKGDAWEG
jgi:hypothetical protein